MAKDIILHCIGEIGFDGATYRALQFDGPGASGLSLDDRMTIANMAIECGGKNAMFEFDAKTQAFVEQRCKLNGTTTAYEPVTRDRKEKFVYERWSISPSSSRPSPAIPTRASASWPRNSATSSLTALMSGSCTGGKTSDFIEFARVLRGKRVAIDTFGVPATPEIVHDLQTSAVGEPDDLGNPRRRRRADDGKRRVRRVPRRAVGHFRSHERAR